MSQENPLLEPFDTAPFSKIKNEHFKPIFKKLSTDEILNLMEDLTFVAIEIKTS